MIQPGFGSTGATAAGGIIGVTSKSKETSIKILNGRQKYNEWAFVHVQTSQRPGQPGGGARCRVSRRAESAAGPGQQPDSPFGMPPGAIPHQGPERSPGSEAPQSRSATEPAAVGPGSRRQFAVWHTDDHSPSSVRRASGRQVSNDRVV